MCSLESLGSCMGIPMFAMGSQDGTLKVAVVAPTSKTRDLTVATWQVSPGTPVRKICQRLHSSCLATMADSGIKVWAYSVSHEGLRPKLQANLEVDLYASPRRSLVSNQSLQDVPVDMSWSYPGNKLVVALSNVPWLVLLDPDRIGSQESTVAVKLDSEKHWNAPTVSK